MRDALRSSIFPSVMKGAESKEGSSHFDVKLSFWLDTKVLDINQCILSINWLICVSIQRQTWFTQTRPKTWLFWHRSVCLWYYLPDNQDLWSHKFCFLSFVVAILSASRTTGSSWADSHFWDPGNVKSFTMHYTPEYPLLLMNIVCSPHLFPTLQINVIDF